MYELGHVLQNGTRYETTVPDTLDLAERAELALNGLGGTLDPDMGCLPFGIIHFTSRTPHMSHWSTADVTCNPKYGQSLPMMRLICGSDRYAEEESANRATLLAAVDSGLYWDRCTSARPWRNIYGDSETRYGQGKAEDIAVVGATGLLVRAILSWRELDGNPEWDVLVRDLVAGMSRVAVLREDYAYYPEKGGWAEPCTYPRSGWLNADEPQSETEGAEGGITCYQANQIYAAAQWHAISGDPDALDLAARLTRFCLKPKFWGGLPDPDRAHAKEQKLPGHIAARLPDPAYTAGHEQGHWYSHFHARALTLRGMLEYGRVTGDERVLEFVRRAYEFTMTQGIPRIGWVNCYPAATNLCEGCALGDLVALGIQLTDSGLGDYWDDVDAVVRNQLAEQQLTRADLLQKVSDAAPEDNCRNTAQPRQTTWDNVIARGIGTFAGCSLPTSIPHPWVMLCCTGNGTRGLYYAWEGIVRESQDTAQVNLLLNRASRLLDVESHLPFDGKVVIRNKAARRIRVRIPFWVNRRELRAKVSSRPVALDWIGRYLIFDDLRPGDLLALQFPVRETTAHYTVNAQTPHERTYACTFRGSTLVDMSPRDESPTSYSLYQRESLRHQGAPLKEVTRFVPDRIITQW